MTDSIVRHLDKLVRKNEGSVNLLTACDPAGKRGNGPNEWLFLHCAHTPLALGERREISAWEQLGHLQRGLTCLGVFVLTCCDEDWEFQSGKGNAAGRAQGDFVKQIASQHQQIRPPVRAVGRFVQTTEIFSVSNIKFRRSPIRGCGNLFGSMKDDPLNSFRMSDCIRDR